MTQEVKRVVQLNHPSPSAREITQPNNLVRNCNRWVRPANSDAHYRVYSKLKGFYLKNLDEVKPHKGIVYSWIEWESEAYYYPLDNKPIAGYYQPKFQRCYKKGTQNTDPYIFGQQFKYSNCSQTGVMLRLPYHSLILFGSAKKHGFELDTVFVVGAHFPAKFVNSLYMLMYSNTYIDTVLSQLNGMYLGDNPSEVNRIYHSETWYRNKDYFSYVPVKSTCQQRRKGFYDKVIIPYDIMSEVTQGHIYNKFKDKDPQEIWYKITQLVLEQKFYLGILFPEELQ